ncbi:MAG TPA: Calx-beta domain-containing protein [Woeseiaceae bacterium]
MQHELTPERRQALAKPLGACSRVLSFPRLRGILHLVGLAAGLFAAAPAFAQTIVTIEVADGEAAETPADPARFVVRRSGGDLLRSVRVPLEISGSATEGADYAPLPHVVVLNLGAQSLAIDVTVSGDDGLFEGDETVTVTLDEDEDDDGQPDGAFFVGNGSASITIVDSPHTVTAEAAGNALEGGEEGEILVRLSGRNESGAPLTVDYSVAGDAEPGVDYTALSGSVAIAPGASSAPVTVRPLDDDALEADESVGITLTKSGDARVSVGDPASASIVVADDDAARDDDGDGLANGAECPEFAACRDSDGDGLADWLDADDDDDGVPTASEHAPDQDTDGDDTPDYLDDDDDGDGRPTREEDANPDGDGNPATSPTDQDSDGVSDYLDADDGGSPQGDPDGDGLTNTQEDALGTDPGDPDSDDDGVNDGDEDTAGTDPLDPRAFADADGDLVPDAVEAADGSSPEDPADFADADGGGTADYLETVTYPAFGLPATDPANAADDRHDTDGDGLPDRFELALASAPDSADSPTADGAGDADGNGVSNAVQEYLAGLGITTAERTGDFDRDGYPDAAEVSLGLDPLSSAAGDRDGDGVPNVIEALAGVDASPATDSDADGVPDAREIALGANPLDASSPVAGGGDDDDGDGVSLAIEHVLAALGVTGDVTAATDSDEDGLADADEIRLGADPLHDEQPVAWIELVQADFGPVRALATGAGPATARARIGGHQSGLTYDWNATSAAVLAVANGPHDGPALSFAPQTLPPGRYELVVSVTRTLGDLTTPTSVVRLALEVLENGTAEALADGDGDGVRDGADATDGRRGDANRLPSEAIAPIVAEPGTRLQLGSTARATLADSALVTPADIAAAGGAEDEFEYVGGIYDFEVTNLPEAGTVVNIVIPQASPIGDAAQYRKLGAQGWVGFVEDQRNAIASAPDDANKCPPPGDAAYRPGLTPGHLCVQLSIEDGGPNDGDAADGRNGIVKDPGGVGTPRGEVVAGQGSGAAGPWLLLVLAGAALLTRRRRLARFSSLALVAACLAGAPPAADADVFVGGGAGMSRLTPDTGDTPFSVSDNGDYGYKVFGGFDLTPLSPNLSVEAFWADLGETALGNVGKLEYSVYGGGLMYGVGSVKAPRVSGYLELGVTRLDIQGDIAFEQEESTSLFFGLAGSFALGRTVFLQLEYEYYADDAQFISLSLVKHFRLWDDGENDVRTIPLPERPAQ